MTRKGKGGRGPGRLESLLDSGDHHAAGAEARRVLAAPDATDADRDAAHEALRRLAPERSALVVAAAGLALFFGIVLLGVLRSR